MAQAVAQPPVPAAEERPLSRYLALAGSYLGLAALSVIFIAPLVWMISMSFKTNEEATTATPTWIPQNPTTEPFSTILTRSEQTPVFRWFINSLLAASFHALLVVITAALAAYALARLRFAGRRAILGAVLAVTMFPQITLVSPLYLVLRALRLINTFPGLVLPYVTFAMPLTVWLLVGFLRQLPRDLEEAAVVDGATRWQSVTRVVLPLAAPGLATTAILTFIYCWNEFLFALAFTLGPERQTVPVAIALFRGQYQVPWGQILAAAVVATAPVAAVVLLFQRRIVQGLTAGAVKG